MSNIRDILSEGLAGASAAAGLDVAVEDVHRERPARREHGDWSSNIALTVAKTAGRKPRDLADELRDQLTAQPPRHVAAVEVAGPGFLNFRLRDSWLYDVLEDVVSGGEDRFARPDLGGDERVQVEFVSANPTGPIHVGNGWWASYGDAVARLLDRCGWQVHREYYVNDTGGQIRLLGARILARRAGAAPPEGG